jgi:hypothetical protein
VGRCIVERNRDFVGVNGAKAGTSTQTALITTVCAPG